MFHSPFHPPTPPRGNRHRRGFSLVELTLVLAIAGVTFAIAAPRYGASLDRYRADVTARRIAADVVLAQARARTASRSQSVTFSLTSNTYRLDGEAGAERAADQYTVRLADSPYFAKLVALSWNDATPLTFNGYGVPNRAATITIRSGSNQRSVSVAAESGTVSIQ